MMLLHIFQTITIDYISHNKTEGRLLFIDIYCIFPRMDKMNISLSMEI